MAGEKEAFEELSNIHNDPSNAPQPAILEFKNGKMIFTCELLSNQDTTNGSLMFQFTIDGFKNQGIEIQEALRMVSDYVWETMQLICQSPEFEKYKVKNV